MVGIVIVSHSKQLALGVQELAAQMVQGNVPLVVAAGVDDPVNPLGTDAMQVYEAIASIFDDDGVLVLMDLGSAVLSAEMALEFLPPEQRQKVYLCAAPLVEGAIAATVAAANGRSIQQVIAEAQGSLIAKTTHLGCSSGHPPVVTCPNQAIFNTILPTREIKLTVNNRLGLHARPSAQFVGTVCRFEAQIQVKNLSKDTAFVRADSINQVATLGVRQGHELLITATGVDAEAALKALQTLVLNNFGEDDSLVLPAKPEPHIDTTPSQGELLGIAASPGVAIAPVVQYQSASVNIPEYHINNLEVEWQRLQSAIQTAKQEIETLLSHTSIQIGDTEAAIFDAHLLFLQDPVLINTARQKLFTQHLNAETVWQMVVDEITSSYQKLEDKYLQERVEDVVDIGRRVLRILLGGTPAPLELTDPAILVASDLTPSDTARLNPAKVLGICMTSGSATSHSAIIARTLGIPAVLGVDNQILDVEDGTIIALDGESGKAWVQPEADTLSLLIEKREAWQNAQAEAKAKAHQPAVTSDGQHIQVLANISNINDAKTAIINGAEGVGLLRTEFLYIDRTHPPSEEEQLTAYNAIAQTLGERPLIIRTIDIGGDKPIDYLSTGLPEANPFLGVRGIRLCLDHPDLFKTHLRAILRASANHNIKMMWPMIATLSEVRTAKKILAEAKAELTQAGITFNDQIKLGVMIETPAAVSIADQLAKEVDFFSIGTNDLSQYVMVGDRTNPRVATLADAMHPAVLRMIKQTVEAAHQANIWVGLCGEVAAEVLIAPILIGLGLDELSVNPQAIASLKQAITQLTMTEAKALANIALQQDSAASVRELVYPIG
ncbi:MAG TPA: phosphoenolpyruvate--protein phosphotransferase [Nostocaceae cyanobacterium]|nr:phosphoenolpyruvate--protein phosphotransferase [Nostocaceae cyanobacterium]